MPTGTPLPKALGGEISIANIFTVTVIATFVVACGPIPEVERSVKHWNSKTSEFFATQRNISDVHSWLREQDVIYTFDESDIIGGKWIVGLDHFHPDTIRCETVSVQLQLTVTDKGAISDYAIGESGPCLW